MSVRYLKFLEFVEQYKVPTHFHQCFYFCQIPPYKTPRIYDLDDFVLLVYTHFLLLMNFFQNIYLDIIFDNAFFNIDLSVFIFNEFE